MSQNIGRYQFSIAFLVSDDFTQLHGVPEDDNCREQVHASDSVVLAFGGTIADFAPAMEADGPLQRVMCLALVEPYLGAALQIGIQNPVDHEQGAFDAADLAQGRGQFVLPRIGSELTQDLAGRDASSGNRSGDAQDIRPIPLDYGLIDLSANQGLQNASARTKD